MTVEGVTKDRVVGWYTMLRVTISSGTAIVVTVGTVLSKVQHSVIVKNVCYEVD